MVAYTMRNIFKYLTQLDFSKAEVKLYISLLKSGPLTVAQLAKKAKINRTAAYSHINSLLEKGIIAKVKGSANKIIANPPDHLYFLVEQKAIRVGMLQEKLPSVISFLSSTLPQTTKNLQSEIKYFKGKAGVKTIYQEILHAEKIRAYFSPGDLVKVFPENEDLFNETLARNPKMEMFEIAADTLEVKPYIDYFGKADRITQHYWKLLPKDIKLAANDILLYNGKVAIINIGDKDNITGVVLENRDYYNNSVQLFDLLWRLLPEPSLK